MSRATELADKLVAGVITDSDWPNTEDEVLRLNVAAELRRLDRVTVHLAEALSSCADSLSAFISFDGGNGEDAPEVSDARAALTSAKGDTQ